jgi:hypothetical protein
MKTWKRGEGAIQNPKGSDLKKLLDNAPNKQPPEAHQTGETGNITLREGIKHSP